MRLIEHTPKRWADFIRARSPIAESIVPLDYRGRRAWCRMSSDWLVAHAIWTISDHRFESRREFQRADSGLYQTLWKRNLLDEIGLEVRYRDWNVMSEEELIVYAKGFIAENGLRGRKDLKKSNPGLYRILGMKDLLDKLGFENAYTDHRNWSAMSDEKLIEFAKVFIAENGIEGRKELEESDGGLYHVLGKRKLLDMVGLGKKLRDWTLMSEEELVGFGSSFIIENLIEGRMELKDADSGLYQALIKRELLDKVGLGKKLRDWAAMDDEELAGLAKRFIAERGIGIRKELEMADLGLYQVLRKRKLLDTAFSDIESSKHAEAVQGVLDALESFGDDP